MESTRYEMLANRLAELIRGGTFAPGDRMPSVRQSSHEHRVSISTVMEAYRRLEDTGLIEARPRSGYYVKAPVLSEARIPTTAAHARKPIHIERASLFEAVMDTVADPRVVPFAAAAPDDSIIPKAKLASISNALFRKHGGAALRYTLPPGRRELRVAVSKRLLGAGIKASPDEILTTHGATEALLLALRATTKRGDLVAVEAPTYFGILHLLRDLGLRAIEIPVSPHAGFVVEALETALKKHRVAACVVQPNFHNPIGGLMPVEAKQRLAALSERHGFAIVEDDVYGELGHDGIRHPSISLYGGHVIHIGAISKTLAPGLRVGWIVPGPHFAEIKRLKSIQCPWNATLSELMVAEFLEAGGYDRHLRRIRQLYAVQCARMRQAVVSSFPDTCRVNQPLGGFVLWIEMPAAFDAEDFAVRAMAENVSLVPGPVFSASGGLRNCFRLSCGFAFGERTLDAVALLGKLAAR
ncbi:PLP-dependent aminotransferase family protein [Luteolibacter sp. LG18]|uniref:aminotransferase-like domain-containing protein n=1 Tax=Luteolibacter sp. LG18 TaxID=2819286 RepID=UPI002B2D523D|nr:GntR family transcriptional regulator [Luteolibacter sp. LG18]